MKIRRVWIYGWLALILAAGPALGVRIKDLAAIKGVRANQLVGYGLVVGLDGTGDKAGTQFTVQALVNMMERLGIHVSKDQVKVKNVAAVMVTAKLPPFARIGNRIDVVISSVGDAQSLVGGTLLMTPLRGVDNQVYALAQGPVAVGGVGADTGGGGTTKNHTLVARISQGGSVEREIPVVLEGKSNLTLTLYNPDFTTAARMAETINGAFGKPLAKALDSGTLNLNIPSELQNDVTRFIARIEPLEVVPDNAARIVVNEKTGTVVIGENVRISTVAVSHGNLNITIRESDKYSLPDTYADSETVATPAPDAVISEDQAKVMVMPGGTTIGQLVRALNAIGVTPRDMISIFQSIKASGALQAELEII